MGKERVRQTERVASTTYTTVCRRDRWREATVEKRKLSAMLCDDLEGRLGDKVGERLKREVYMYTYN